jgi:DNA-binding transcriptional regulator of glucitol operon
MPIMIMFVVFMVCVCGLAAWCAWLEHKDGK